MPKRNDSVLILFIRRLFVSITFLFLKSNLSDLDSFLCQRLEIIASRGEDSRENLKVKYSCELVCK